MRIAVLLAVISLTILSARCGVASVDMAPPVTAETIKGSWEALAEDYERVFRLELADGSGWLAVGLQFVEPMIFALTKTRWHKGGVELHFRGVGQSSKGARGPDDSTPYTAVLRLKGVADTAGGGLLSGVFVLCPEQKPENLWKVRFLKDTALPNFKTLLQLSEQAKQAIERQKQTPK